MRILIVSQYFWPENFRINDLATELQRRGHQMTVLSGQPNYPSGKIFPEYARNPEHYAALEGVRIIRVPLRPRGEGGLNLLRNYLSYAWNACTHGAWRLRGESFDLVLVCQLSPVTVGLPGAWLAALKKCPMAMWVLDLWPESLAAIGVLRSPLGLGIVGKLVGFIYRRCDLIFAQSRSFIPKIRARASARQRIEYSPSWAETLFQQETQPATAGETTSDSPHSQAEQSQPAAQASRPPELPALAPLGAQAYFDIMFAGNIGEAQDFPTILAAAERLRSAAPQIRWLIVGEGRMSPWVAEQIRQRGLEQQVLMLGRFPVERMPAFFAHADAMLVTLADEAIFAMTIPGKLQSYLAAGRPVLAALNGEGADVVRQADAGMVAAAGNAAELAQAALELAKLSPQQRLAMGQRGLAYSKAEFDRDKIIQRIESWCGELSSAANPVSPT